MTVPSYLHTALLWEMNSHQHTPILTVMCYAKIAPPAFLEKVTPHNMPVWCPQTSEWSSLIGASIRVQMSAPWMWQCDTAFVTGPLCWEHRLLTTALWQGTCGVSWAGRPHTHSLSPKWLWRDSWTCWDGGRTMQRWSTCSALRLWGGNAGRARQPSWAPTEALKKHTQRQTSKRHALVLCNVDTHCTRCTLHKAIADLYRWRTTSPY